jgi:hypothetical protein
VDIPAILAAKVTVNEPYGWTLRTNTEHVTVNTD